MSVMMTPDEMTGNPDTVAVMETALHACCIGGGWNDRRDQQSCGAQANGDELFHRHFGLMKIYASIQKFAMGCYPHCEAVACALFIAHTKRIFSRFTGCSYHPAKYPTRAPDSSERWNGPCGAKPLTQPF
jgi:hypothetical protein